MTALVIPLDHFFERLLRPVVHVRARDRYVADSRRFESTAVFDRRLRGKDRSDAGKAQEKRADRFRQQLFECVRRS